MNPNPTSVVFDCMVYAQAMISRTGFAEHIAKVVGLYTNPFDADDSHYVILAVFSGANLTTSRDGDLLRLMDETRPEACELSQRFPHLRILPPEKVLEILRLGKSGQ